ncbi:DUF1015 domain-containing protein [Clostridiales bacterium FE2011]|nr:DUF1015 domain-containing protein [Clostridiales bacterium FE2011]QTE73717.1 DUF1015 domain-containing protein [Clostridiales bacterium FE2010]
MSFERIGIRPAQILLPAAGVKPETWACIACDQYTSEPEYWEKAFAVAGDAPSAIRLILPEYNLKNSESLIPQIHRTMADYLAQGLLTPAVNPGFILCERTIASGTRLGLVCAVDLEQYSFEKGSLPLIRPTEQTITDRLPPRLKIRRGAPVELTHIMILIDDPDRTVLEPLQAAKASLRKVYDFDLMMNGGHLAGWAVDSAEALAQVDQSLNALMDTKGENPLLLAVGDGNHSLATAKAYWNEIREGLSEAERENHPARYALCEIVNIHDEALLFEPIYRIVTGTTRAAVMADWKAYAEAKGMSLAAEGSDHRFTVVSADGEETVAVLNPEGAIPCETIQKFLDSFLSRHPEAGIDFIHGEGSLRALAAKPETVGFLLPDIDKHSFFKDVEKLGVLPRKTFSMGEADEKRFYMEAKKI